MPDIVEAGVQGELFCYRKALEKGIELSRTADTHNNPYHGLDGHTVRVMPHVIGWKKVDTWQYKQQRAIETLGCGSIEEGSQYNHAKDANHVLFGFTPWYKKANNPDAFHTLRIYRLLDIVPYRLVGPRGRRQMVRNPERITRPLWDERENRWKQMLDFPIARMELWAIEVNPELAARLRELSPSDKKFRLDSYNSSVFGKIDGFPF